MNGDLLKLIHLLSIHKLNGFILVVWSMRVVPGGFEQVSTCFPPEQVAAGLPACGGV
jgi:hypothetical protein